MVKIIALITIHFAEKFPHSVNHVTKSVEQLIRRNQHLLHKDVGKYLLSKALNDYCNSKLHKKVLNDYKKNVIQKNYNEVFETGSL